MTREKPPLEKPSDAPTGRHQMLEAYPELGYNVVVTADRTDSIGVLVWDLHVKRTSPFPDGTTLRTWADRIAGRASGLLESLKVLEVDDTDQVAILRSDKPAHKNETIAYYEVKLSGTNEATVRRYQIEAQNGKRREQVAFAVTHEALAKLAGDIAEVA